MSKAGAASVNGITVDGVTLTGPGGGGAGIHFAAGSTGWDIIDTTIQGFLYGVFSNDIDVFDTLIDDSDISNNDNGIFNDNGSFACRT